MICDRWGQCIAEGLNEKRHEGKCNNNWNFGEKCIISCGRQSIIVCQEKGKSYRLENTKKNLIMNFQMDGGVIKVEKTVQQGTKKCDNVILIQGDKKAAIMVELKGTDIKQALLQLRSTFEQYKDVFKEIEYVYARCVSTNCVPNLLANPEYVKLQKVLGKKGSFKRIKQGCTERDIDLEHFNKV